MLPQKKGALGSSSIPPVSCSTFNQKSHAICIIDLHYSSPTPLVYNSAGLGPKFAKILSTFKLPPISFSTQSSGKKQKMALTREKSMKASSVAGTFIDRWSDLSLIIGLSGHIGTGIYQCHEISTYLSKEMSWSSLRRILLWKSEIVSSVVAVDHRTSKRHWSN